MCGGISVDLPCFSDPDFTGCRDISRKGSYDICTLRFDSVRKGDFTIFLDDEPAAKELTSYGSGVSENSIAGAIHGGIDDSVDG